MTKHRPDAHSECWSHGDPLSRPSALVVEPVAEPDAVASLVCELPDVVPDPPPFPVLVGGGRHAIPDTKIDNATPPSQEIQPRRRTIMRTE